MAESVVGLEETLHKIAKENKFANYNVHIKAISSEGANYSSKLYLVTISNAHGSLYLFAKVLLLGDKIRSQGLNDMVKIEPFVYKTLSKIYRHLEEKHNISEEYRLEFSKFYGQNPTRGQEILVLEDLVAQGYCVYDRFESADWTYAYKAISELAKFHALSFAYEREQPAEFQKALETLKIPVEIDEVMEKVITKSLETALTVTKEKNKCKLMKFFSKAQNKKYFHNMKPLRRGVLIHGDFRMSNIMHKVDKNGDYQLKVMDYQSVHLGSPVVDLIYFIFTGTDEEFRSKHYLPLLNHYYTKLSMAMRRLGLKPNEIYSREDFDYDLEQPRPCWLWVMTTFRILFIPFFLFCNYKAAEKTLPILINNDWVYWTAAVLLGWSSGHSSSLGTMYVNGTVAPEHASIAGMIGGATLVTGIVFGITFTRVCPKIVTMELWKNI